MLPATACCRNRHKAPVFKPRRRIVIGTEKENTISIEMENADRDICSLEGRWPA